VSAGDGGDGGRTGESVRKDVGLSVTVGLRRNVWAPGNTGRVLPLVWKVVVVGVGLSRNVCLTTAFVVIVILGLRRGIIRVLRAGSSAGERWVMYVVVDLLVIGFQRTDAKR